MTKDHLVAALVVSPSKLTLWCFLTEPEKFKRQHHQTQLMLVSSIFIKYAL